MNKTIAESKIRRLQAYELENVCGGFEYGTGARGIFSSRNFLRASRLAGSLGLLYGAYQVGYDIGTYGYKTYTSYKYSSR